MRNINPESQVLLKLLQDGQWQPYEEVFSRLTGAVAPGKALRKYEAGEAARVRANGPRKGPELSEEAKIASGRRALAAASLHSMSKRHIEVVWTDQGRMVRRRATPLPVADPFRIPPPEPGEQPEPDAARPDSGACADRCPPAAPPTPPDVAFFSEGQVRQILAEVVEDVCSHVIGEALDKFQRGMRGFLLGRFADLERLVRPGDWERRERPGARRGR